MTNTPGNDAVTRLVITSGDLPGLVAAAIVSEDSVRRESIGAGRPVVWSASALGHDAVSRHAASVGLRVVRRETGGEPVPGVGLAEATNRLLLDAGTASLGLGCPVVVWPVLPAGPASTEPALVELMADAVNRATLVSRLVSLDAPGVGLPEVRFETPFVDLTDQQLAELACDLGVRFEDCWWWSADSSAASAERARWGPLLPVSS